MDSNRLRLNDYDLSTTTESYSTEVVGYTVVKAPKGPTKPVRIPANSSAMLKDIFGSASEEYPELYEVETFNKEYDIYVSAPYESATVPVAYLTPQGIVKGSNTVAYTSQIEQYIEDGTYLSDDGFETTSLLGSLIPSKPNGEPETEIPIDYEINHLNSYGLTSEEDTYSEYVGDNKEYKSFAGGLAIKLGLSYNELKGYKDKKGSIKIVDSEGNPEKIELSDIFSTSSSHKIGHFKLLETETGSNLIFMPISSITDSSLQTVDAEDTTEDTSSSGTPSGGATGGTTPSQPAQIDYFDMSGNPQKANSDKVKDYSYTGLVVILDGLTDTKYTKSTVYLTLNIAEKDIHAVIFPKYPSKRKLHIDFTPFDALNLFNNPSVSDKRNVLSMTAYEVGSFHGISNPISGIVGSIDSDAVSASGTSLAFGASNSLYNMQNLVCVYPVKAFKDSDITNTSAKGYASIDLEGGTRLFGDEAKDADKDKDKDKDGTEGGESTGSASAESSTREAATTDVNTPKEDTSEETTTAQEAIEVHERGWKEAEDSEYSDVDIFFDSTRHNVDVSGDNVVLPNGKFFSLYKKHPLAGFIFNATIAPSALKEEATKKYTTPLEYGANYWNICNEGLIVLGNGKIISPLTGARALMQARIIENKFGGAAPMFTNTGSPAIGGVLSSIASISKLRYKYDKDMQSSLDTMNFNPVISDRNYGIMLTGQKTCKAGALTDWSYIGHVSAFLNFKREVRKYVMIPQLGKPNNPYYRELRKDQVLNILNRRLEGGNRIWAEGVVDTSTVDGCNDALALKARKFVINVKVKVDIFSEYVELNFTNVDQETELA